MSDIIVINTHKRKEIMFRIIFLCKLL